MNYHMAMNHGQGHAWFLETQHCLCHIFVHLLVHGRIAILHSFLLRETFAHFQLLTLFIPPPILDSIKLCAGTLCMLTRAM